MAETTEKTGEKKLSVTPTKTLTLKGRGVEQGVVRQSFSHGRTKAVVVEKVKSRVGGAPGRPEAPPPPVVETKPARPTGGRPAAAPQADAGRRASTRDLDQAVRRRAAHAHRRRAEGARPRACRRPAARGRRAQDRRRRGAASRRRATRSNAPSARPPKPASARKTSAAVTTKKPSARPSRRPRSASAARDSRRTTTAARPADGATRARGRRGRGPAAAPRAGAGGPARPAPAAEAHQDPTEKRRGRLTLVTALSADEVRERSVASFRRRIQRLKGHRQRRAQGKAGPRGHDSGIHHHPGTRQPHGRAARST